MAGGKNQDIRLTANGRASTPTYAEQLGSGIGMSGGQPQAANGSPTGGLQPVAPQLAEQERQRQEAAQNQDLYGKINSRMDAEVDRMPFLGTVGKEFTDTMGGMAQGIQGVFSGDKKQAKEGVKRLGEGMLSAATGGALRAMNNPPPKSYMGGSAEALNAKRAQYEQGMLLGLGQNARGELMAGQGAGIAGVGAAMGGGTYDAAGNLYGTGMGIGASGIGAQDAAIGQAINTAGMQVGSLAAAQQQMANDANSRQMMAQASAARGGNQAAAMRNAQAQGSQNALVTNQQLGLMRLKEEQDRKDSMVQAQQFAASQYGDRASMGYGTATQGLGAQNTATGQVLTAGSTIGQIGSNVMGSGNDQSKAFLNAEVEQNKAQLESDKANASAKQAAKGGVGGIVGKVIGSIF